MDRVYLQISKSGERQERWSQVYSSYTNVIVPSDQQKVMVMSVMNVAITYTYVLAQALLTKLL